MVSSSFPLELFTQGGTAVPPPFANGEKASLVIGQTTFRGSGAATTSSGLSGPFALTFDPHGNLWVADAGNNRVLEFRPPFSNGEGASVVIGQKTFTGSTPATTGSGLSDPSGVTFDAKGNLWVTDEVNNRLLEFRPPFSNGEKASLVIGQSSFTTRAAAETRTGLFGPQGVAFDAKGNLWVADVDNNRVLEFSNSN